MPAPHHPPYRSHRSPRTHRRDTTCRICPLPYTFGGDYALGAAAAPRLALPTRLAYYNTSRTRAYAALLLLALDSLHLPVHTWLFRV